MTSVYPSSSVYLTDAQSFHFDTNQLSRALQEAAPSSDALGRDKARPLKSAGPSSGSDAQSSQSTLFHLHNSSIEVTLCAPPAILHYWRRDDQPNPDYEEFSKFRDQVRSATEPLIPLTLCKPQPRLLRTPPSRIGNQRPFGNAHVFLPSSHAKKPVLQLHKALPATGNDWLPSATAWDMENWLQATVALDPDEPSSRKTVYKDEKRRLLLQTGLQICWVPDGEEADDGADLKLLVTIEVYLDLSTAYDPLPSAGHDLLGFVLHSLIPSATTEVATSEAKTRAKALQRFFDCLRPAPDLSISCSYAALQPQQMVAKLLPFQTRTVCLLLRREGAPIVENRKSVPAVDPDGFWSAENLSETVGRVAYRRVTGELVALTTGETLSRKDKGKATNLLDEEAQDGLSAEERSRLPLVLDLSGVRGTMLCEEMGLGKTVEAIALILLHRHPLSTTRADPAISRPALEVPELGDGLTGPVVIRPRARSTSHQDPDEVPTIDLRNNPPGLDDSRIRAWVGMERQAFSDRKSWDEQSQLNVTEVATTLIVTPPSLLKQWISEMRRHAPSLRVCVYEGWKSLAKAFEHHHQALIKVRQAEAEKKKRKAADKFRKQTVRKYSKSLDGSRVKVESDEDDEEGDCEKVSAEGAAAKTQRLFVDYIRAHDVVVTTYNELSHDLKVALPAPPRSRRVNANYRLGDRARSPLVMVEWWRVVMDEVQLCGDQTSAANMVSLIPRKLSLAVSGTPAKADIKDLMGSLRFLRVPVLPEDNRLWHRLQQPPMRAAFEGVFRQLAVRTTKKEVAGEFHLPLQSRSIVPVELSEIELTYYDDTLDRFRRLLGLPADGSIPTRDTWVLDRSLFRSCLQNLRQICTHIQVGQMQGIRGEHRLNLGRELMSMTEALDKMKNDHSQEYLTVSRLQMRAMIRKAQLMVQDEGDDLRYLNAISLYEKVRHRSEKQIGPVREHLKQLIGTHDNINDDADSVTPDRAMSQQERERVFAMTHDRTTIRELSLLVHQACFFTGDINHVRKAEAEEVECYEQAEIVRREILTRPLQVSNASVGVMQRALAHSEAVQAVNDLQSLDTNMRGGLLSHSVIAQANDLLQILNENAVLVFGWREKIVQFLSLPIESESDDLPAVGQGQDVDNPEKEYYAEALKAQGDVEAYLIAYASAVADRKEFMNEERSELAKHDARTIKQRATLAAKMAGKELPAEMAEAPDDVAELAITLMGERQVFRDARKEKDCERPLKAMLVELSNIANSQGRQEEVQLAQRAATIIRTYIIQQTKYVEKLTKELDVFRKTFNKRLMYFASLQEISDSVQAAEHTDLQKDLTVCTDEINSLEARLTRMVIKGRYLQYIGTRGEGDDDLREDCIICMGSSDDSQAVLLKCGHFFCKSCFNELRRSGQGRKCPSCRTEIMDKEITKIKLARNPNEEATEKREGLMQIDDENPSTSQSYPTISLQERDNQRRVQDFDRLRVMDIEKRRRIAHLDMMGDYGSKINFLIKHLLWYKLREPDARHVVFSNWSDSLNIVITALEANGISHISFDSRRGLKDAVDSFTKNDSISVFLLHAERESSGLTLTQCRVVHLLEPVLKHSFELQAIGRVDRLGQDKETMVYCYATMPDTVESRILSQGVRNHTSIYLKDENADSVVADMPNVVSAAHKGGDISNDGDEEELLRLIM